MESPTPDRLGDIYETIQPRMAAQKRGYLRTRFGAALAAPLLLVGGAVYAANTESTVSQVTDTGVAMPAPEVEEQIVPEDEAPPTREDEDLVEGEESEGTEDGEDLLEDEGSDDAGEDDAKPEQEFVEIAPPEDGALTWQTVDLGLAGTAEVGVEGEKHLTLGDLDLNDGWEAIQIQGKDRYIVLQLTNGDTKLLVTLKVKLKTGDMKVKFEDLAPVVEETKEKAKAKAEPAPKPSAPAPSDGFSYSSAGGSVYISRSGNTVSISVTGTAGGFTSQTLYNHGDIAKVVFSNGETYVYVMGQIKGGKLVPAEWTEHHAPKWDAHDKGD